MSGPGGERAGDADVDVVVRVPGALRNLCGGDASLSFGLPPPVTVADVLDAIGRSHPPLERRIRDEQGVVRTHVNLFVGDDDVRALDGLGTRLAPGTELTILAAISGGQGSQWSGRPTWAADPGG